MPTKLNDELITAAILGFEEQKRHIDMQIAELRAMLSGGSARTAATPGALAQKPRKFSAAARQRMKEAQRRRWAKIRGESGKEKPAPKAAKGKRRLSAAGRAAIIAAAKKRWAAIKAAKKAPAKGKKAAATQGAAETAGQ